MRRLALAGFCLAMLGASAGAGARTPVPPPKHEYYGPIRICDRAFAFDVREGEGYRIEGYPDHYQTHLILSEQGYLSLGSPWLYDAEPLKRHARPVGEIEVSGQRLQRFDMSTKSRPRAFVYVYVVRAGAHSWKYAIESDLFDGSEGDRPILDRIAFGDRGRQLCAAVPDALKAGPERERPNAFWLSPARHPGPATVCAFGLAFDVGPGEAAILPWRPDSNFFRIAAGDRRADVSGLDERVWRRGGEPDVQGPLALDPRFVVRSLGKSNAWEASPILAPGPDSHFVLLSRRADGQPIWPHRQPVGFTFGGEWTEAELQAFVQRLRTRRADDRCLWAGPR